MEDRIEVDTTQHTGTCPENTPAWNSWAGKHLPELRVLRSAGLLGKGNGEWRNVAEHSLVVNATAVLLGRKMLEDGIEIDMDVVDKASMLHDASKRLDKEQGISHADKGSSLNLFKLLYKSGYSTRIINTAQGTGRTLVMPAENLGSEKRRRRYIGSLPVEQLVVAYADARVRNTDIVSLEKARFLNGLKVPADETFYDEQWHPFYESLEAHLMSGIDDPDFGPDSINNQSVIEMVKAEAQI